MKSRGGKSQRREEKRRRNRKSQKKEDPGARKGSKVAKHFFLQWFEAPEGRKVGSLKMRDEKLHAIAARSTFPSQNVHHFWNLRCRKSARRCGAKHMSKSKCTKHTRGRTTLEVDMSKKCTPLWREAHFEVKMLKTPGVRTGFRRSDVISRSRRKGLCTLSKVSKKVRVW